MIRASAFQSRYLAFHPIGSVSTLLIDSHHTKYFTPDLPQTPLNLILYHIPIWHVLIQASAWLYMNSQQYLYYLQHFTDQALTYHTDFPQALLGYRAVLTHRSYLLREWRCSVPSIQHVMECWMCPGLCHMLEVLLVLSCREGCDWVGTSHAVNRISCKLTYPHQGRARTSLTNT